MSSNRPDQWMHFADFFSSADIGGTDPSTAAEELLRQVSLPTNAVKVAGFVRKYEWISPVARDLTAEQEEVQRRWEALADQLNSYPPVPENERAAIEAQMRMLERGMSPEPFSGWRERLPRDPHLRPVSRAVWGGLDIRSDGTSRWPDDDDDSAEMTVDWISGSASIIEDFDKPDITLQTDYLALRIDRKAGEQLLVRLAGLPMKRPGRKADPWELERAEEAIRLKARGEPRSEFRLAGDLSNSTLPSDEWEKQRDRIYANIRALKVKLKNSRIR